MRKYQKIMLFQQNFTFSEYKMKIRGQIPEMCTVLTIVIDIKRFWRTLATWAVHTTFVGAFFTGQDFFQNKCFIFAFFVFDSILEPRIGQIWIWDVVRTCQHDCITLLYVGIRTVDLHVQICQEQKQNKYSAVNVSNKCVHVFGCLLGKYLIIPVGGLSSMLWENNPLDYNHLLTIHYWHPQSQNGHPKNKTKMHELEEKKPKILYW